MRLGEFVQRPRGKSKNVIFRMLVVTGLMTKTLPKGQWGSH